MLSNNHLYLWVCVHICEDIYCIITLFYSLFLVCACGCDCVQVHTHMCQALHVLFADVSMYDWDRRTNPGVILSGANYFFLWARVSHLPQDWLVSDMASLENLFLCIPGTRITRSHQDTRVFLLCLHSLLDLNLDLHVYKSNIFPT